VHVKTQKQTSRLTARDTQAGEALYEIAQASAAATADLHAKDPERTPISLLKMLHHFRAAYRLRRERYQQRRQLMEMDDRQLKDIGVTAEQAEQEARKPIWKD
jgi:uncharacterized protein YjiS (DUF1127 family)